ncbi:efflux RND transporter permease subunit [Escherichia coli]
MLVFLVMYLFFAEYASNAKCHHCGTRGVVMEFAILAAFSSINTLTMFGMVLAIGLLVDDAIVVVENVKRVMMEDKLPPKKQRKNQIPQIQERRTGGYRDGAVSGYYFRWHSSAVLLGQFLASSLSPSFGNGAFCSGGIDSYPCVMCNAARTHLS